MNVENIKKVRDVIAGLPIERFSMATEGALADENAEGRFEVSNDTILHNCGTIACIAGWTCAVLGNPHDSPSMPAARTHLGLAEETGRALFLPTGWDTRDYKPAQAVAVLDHLIATGEARWSVADRVSA